MEPNGLWRDSLEKARRNKFEKGILKVAKGGGLTLGLTPKRTGVGVVAVIIVVIVIVAVASVAALYVLTSRVTPTKSSDVTSTSALISTTKSTSIATLRTSSTKLGIPTGSTGLTYYSGSFNYSIPLGPSGVRSLPNGTAQYYNSTEAASGTFTFFVAADNYSGSGTGHGTITVATRGFCTGSATIPYTFIVPDATTILGGNITVFFANPSPGNYTVPLTCTGDMTGVSTATNNPHSFLPVYPNELTIPLASLPTSEIFHGSPSKIFTWGYSVRETG